MGNAATEFPGDQALLPQSSHVPPQGSLHLPGAGEETQLSPCFQRCKNKKADGPAPSAHPPPASRGLSATPPSLAKSSGPREVGGRGWQSMNHVIPGRGH